MIALLIARVPVPVLAPLTALAIDHVNDIAIVIALEIDLAMWLRLCLWLRLYSWL